jgi:hypothetical protein
VRPTNFEFFDGDRGDPPKLEQLIGTKVQKAWLLPEGKTLAVRFEGGQFLMIEAIPAVDFEALSIEIGDVLPNANFTDIDGLAREPHVRALIGRRLTGLKGNVLMFGSVGARIERTGITWVREA